MTAQLRVKLDTVHPKEQFDTTVSLICRNYHYSDPNRHYGLNSGVGLEWDWS